MRVERVRLPPNSFDSLTHCRMCSLFVSRIFRKYLGCVQSSVGRRDMLSSCPCCLREPSVCGGQPFFFLLFM